MTYFPFSLTKYKVIKRVPDMNLFSFLISGLSLLVCKYGVFSRIRYQILLELNFSSLNLDLVTLVFASGSRAQVPPAPWNKLDLIYLGLEKGYTRINFLYLNFFLWLCIFLNCKQVKLDVRVKLVHPRLNSHNYVRKIRSLDMLL